MYIFLVDKVETPSQTFISLATIVVPVDSEGVPIDFWMTGNTT